MSSSSISSNTAAKYFAIDGDLQKIREDCKTKFYSRKQGATIFKKGAFGSVSEVCLRSNCRFVAKLLPVGSPDQKKVFYREVRIARPLGEMGLAPKIHDVFICLGAGFIIMEAWDGSLRTLLEKDRVARRSDLNQIGELIKGIHRMGVIHNDLHVGNILYRMVKGKRVFTITDFGLSTFFNSPKEVISLEQLPTSKSPNIFFPAFDYYKLSNSLEIRSGIPFEDYFLEKNYLTNLEYLLVDKYWYYEPKSGLASKMTFLEFLDKLRIAKDMIRTLPTNPENAYLPLSPSNSKKSGKKTSKKKSKKSS